MGGTKEYNPLGAIENGGEMTPSKLTSTRSSKHLLDHNTTKTMHDEDDWPVAEVSPLALECNEEVPGNIVDTCVDNRRPKDVLDMGVIAVGVTGLGPG